MLPGKWKLSGRGFHSGKGGVCVAPDINVKKKIPLERLPKEDGGYSGKGGKE